MSLTITPQPNDPDRATVSDAILQREREYQQLLVGRNRLLADSAALRAVDALRTATEKLTDLERKYGATVKERLAALKATGFGTMPTGNGVTGPMFGGSGTTGTTAGAGTASSVPVNAMQAAQRQVAAAPMQHGPGGTSSAPAPQSQEQLQVLRDILGQLRQQSGGATPRAEERAKAAGFWDGSRETALTGGRAVFSAAGQYAAMNANPFMDERNRVQRLIETIPGAGTVREIAAEATVGGAARREAAKRLALHEIEERGTDLFFEDRHRQRMRFIDAGVMRDARYSDPNGGPIQGATTWGLAPLPSAARDTAAVAYREGRANLPHEDAYRQSLARREAAEFKLKELKRVDGEYVGDEAKAARLIGEQQKIVQANQGDGTAAAGIRIQDARIRIADLQRAAVKFQELRLDVAERSRQAEEDIARATADAERAKQALGGSILGNLRQRESVATEQARRVGGMGPGEFIAGNVMFRQLEEMEKNGADMSMVPREVRDISRTMFPELEGARDERIGAGRLDRQRESGSLPAGEYRDRLATVRGQVDAVERGVRTDREATDAKLVDELFGVVGRALKAAMDGQQNRFEKLVEALKRKFETEQLFNQNR